MIFSKEEPYGKSGNLFFRTFSLFLPHQPPVFRPETLPMKPIPICRVLAALLLLPLFACGPDGVVPRRTVIAGRVVDLAEGASGAVLFNTEDPFALKSRMAARVSPEANDFHFVFRTAYTTGMTGVYGDFFDLIVSPGDSVYVTIDAGRMRAGDPDAIRFSGDHARTNNALASVAGLKRRLCEQAPAVEGDPQEYLASYRRYRAGPSPIRSPRAGFRPRCARRWPVTSIWCRYGTTTSIRRHGGRSSPIRCSTSSIWNAIWSLSSTIRPASAIISVRFVPTRSRPFGRAQRRLKRWRPVAARLDADPQIGRGLRDYLLYGCMEGMCANGAVPAERMAGLFLDPAYAARVRERRRNVLLSALSRFPACCGAMRRDGSIRCPTASCSRRWRPVIRGRRSTSISVRHGAVLAAAS